MKNLNNLLFTVITLVLFSSCASLNNSDFSSAKYLDGQNLTRSKVKVAKHDGGTMTLIEKPSQATTIDIELEEKTIILAEASNGSAPALNQEGTEVPVINFQKTVKEKTSLSKVENSERPTLKQRVANRVIKKAIERSSRRPADEAQTVILVILCFLLPPLAVYIKTDDIGLDFWISVLLTIFFWVPGIIWALYVCFFR